MSPRQARRERREAERKARKAEIKRMKAVLHTSAEPPKQNPDREGGERACAPLQEFSEANSIGFVSQNGTPTAEGTEIGFVSQLHEPNTHAQTRREINRANAQYSTGPRSIAGKLASSRNSLQHGLASGTLIIPGEDPAAFDQLTAALLDEHQPASETETILVHDMARSWWLTQRAIRLQNECFTDSGIDDKRLSLLLRYQTTHERSFHKALNALLKLKRIHNGTPAVKEGIGFVSQNSPSPAAEIGFVSQNHPNPALEIGFVSQNPAAGAPNPPPALADAA